MRRRICAVILLLGMLCLLIEGTAENGTATEEETAWYETVIEAYRDLIHQEWKVDSDIPYTDTILTVAWRKYVDDPRSEPAWALCEIDGETALLIGDRRDPEGTCRRIFTEHEGNVMWSPEGDGVTPFTLETEGKTISGDVQVQDGHTVQIAWTRFWESRKAVVAAEAEGGLVSRTGLGEGSYTLGKQETGLVIVVDQVVDGWAWYRYHATRQGVSASSWDICPMTNSSIWMRPILRAPPCLPKTEKPAGRQRSMSDSDRPRRPEKSWSCPSAHRWMCMAVKTDGLRLSGTDSTVM